MAPDYGATTGFWPVDGRRCLLLTGRSEHHVALVEAHARRSCFAMPAPDPSYDRVVPVDLAGIRRQHRRPGMPHLRKDTGGSRTASWRDRARSEAGGASADLPGAIAIAAITSCTNIANAHGMIRAGLLAKAAAARLAPRPG
jgi:aconitate hydratase